MESTTASNKSNNNNSNQSLATNMQCHFDKNLKYTFIVLFRFFFFILLFAFHFTQFSIRNYGTASTLSLLFQSVFNNGWLCVIVNARIKKC